jgi:hypothetical protein
MDDGSFKFLFEPIMTEVVARYQPEAIVLQSGARAARRGGGMGKRAQGPGGLAGRGGAGEGGC